VSFEQATKPRDRNQAKAEVRCFEIILGMMREADISITRVRASVRYGNFAQSSSGASPMGECKHEHGSIKQSSFKRENQRKSARSVGIPYRIPLEMIFDSPPQLFP